jgi:hypothetical protein
MLAERTRRLLDVIQLQPTDRIPVQLRLGYMVAELAGTTRQEMFDNPERARTELVKAALEFQPDSVFGITGTPGPSRALGDRSTKWPGYGLDEHGSFQFVEADFMRAEDYDDMLEDMSDWGVRVFLPRVFGELAGLAKLPPLGLSLFGYYGAVFNAPAFADLELQRSMRALAEAGRLAIEFGRQARLTGEALNAAGFPAGMYNGVLMEAPFDFLSDTMRGMKGIFLDMRRCPDKLLAAQQKVLRLQLKHAIASTRAAVQAGLPAYAGIPLHRGSDEFMSLPQFERFYWPQLKTMLVTLVENGITPVVFYESCWDKRLQYLVELPRGKTVGWFEKSDIFKVKQVIGDTMCIMGGMSVSMLTGGTVEEVRAHTRRLCEEVGKGGGYIMSTSTGELETCRRELVHAWINATREFGDY